jgi:hypothetical protein
MLMAPTANPPATAIPPVISPISLSVSIVLILMSLL